MCVRLWEALRIYRRNISLWRMYGDLSLEMPVHTKDLNYDERVIKLAGKQVGEGLQYLLGQVQNGVIPQ